VYQKKSVTHIGLVENIIEADWNDKKGLSIKDSKKKVTLDQETRLSGAIRDSISKGWIIDTNHRFFLLKDLTETDFRKSSPGGIFRVRYFNLEDELGKNVPDDISQIAEKLKQVTWK
jgi:hypothetical protein